MKRDSSLIKDHTFRNYQLRSSQSNKSLSYKITNDYRTKVTCLPGTQYNAHVEDLDMPNHRSISKFREKYSKENSDYNILSPKGELNDYKKIVPAHSNKIINIYVDKTTQGRNNVVRGEINNSNYHLFNTSSKRLLNMKNRSSNDVVVQKPLKRPTSRRDLMSSFEEAKLVSCSKGKKPNEIRNVFSSQINLN